jgi:hypothetical protein
MDKVDKDELMDKSKGLNREMKEKRGRLIFLSQFDSLTKAAHLPMATFTQPSQFAQT